MPGAPVQQRRRAIEAIAAIATGRACGSRGWAILRHMSPLSRVSFVHGYTVSKDHATNYCSLWLHSDAVKSTVFRVSTVATQEVWLRIRPTEDAQKPLASRLATALHDDSTCPLRADVNVSTTPGGQVMHWPPHDTVRISRSYTNYPPLAHTTSPRGARGAPAMITRKRGPPSTAARNDSTRRPEDAPIHRETSRTFAHRSHPNINCEPAKPRHCTDTGSSARATSSSAPPLYENTETAWPSDATATQFLVHARAVTAMLPRLDARIFKS